MLIERGALKVRLTSFGEEAALRVRDILRLVDARARPTKGQRFFTPRLRFKSYDELNAWLTDKCIAYAKSHHHPELTGQTIWEVFEAERPKLVPYAGRFDVGNPGKSSS